MNEDKRILIVDDEEKILNIFSKQLNLLGHFNVDTALGGNSGLEKLKKVNYDVLLLDLMMPDKDGLEVLKEISQFNFKPKIIILTNLISEEQKKLTRDFGVSDYVIKTEVDPNDLINKIKNLLTIPSH